MIKKEYQKPTMKVVLLRHRTQLMAGSPLGNVSTHGVDPGDEFTIDNTPGTTWGR